TRQWKCYGSCLRLFGNPTRSRTQHNPRPSLYPAPARNLVRGDGWHRRDVGPSGQMDGVAQGSARTLHLQRSCTVLGIEVLGDFAEWHGDAFRRHQEEPFGAPLVVENGRSLAGNQVIVIRGEPKRMSRSSGGTRCSALALPVSHGPCPQEMD